MKNLTRRAFVGAAAAVAAASTIAELPGADATTHQARSGLKGGDASSFCDVLRIPDWVGAFTEGGDLRKLLRQSGSSWQSGGVEVRTIAAARSLAVSVLSPSIPLTRIHLRWNLKVNGSLICMGDAWERSYGALSWNFLAPERVMPWYFATHDGSVTHGYGVQTGAASFCFWQIDPEGVSLWLDVGNGGLGVRLGERELAAATVVSREGRAGETPTEAIAALCRLMCPAPRLPKGPVYGTNDWYYAYGDNSAQGILRDTELVVSLAPQGAARPFSVVDAGWQGNVRFPSMGRLAEQIRGAGARPGIWIRPVLAPAGTSQNLLLPAMRRGAQVNSDNELAYDPTIPEALDAILAKVTQVVNWKYELVKHDFSTYDLLGQWGFAMGGRLTKPGWRFHDQSRTNAEIVLSLYQALRRAAGEQTLLLGCNTVGHLSAGLFELQRTGDDTSGRAWERTRRMGINTLAYRLPQNETFFLQDADCVGITRSIPWDLNSQWMDLLSRSGTALFISPEPGAIGPEQKKAIANAFAAAGSGAWNGYPTDWLHLTTPETWEFQQRGAASSLARQYRWCGESGYDPFPA